MHAFKLCCQSLMNYKCGVIDLEALLFTALSTPVLVSASNSDTGKFSAKRQISVCNIN